jgi:hypothetical protein
VSLAGPKGGQRRCGLRLSSGRDVADHHVEVETVCFWPASISSSRRRSRNTAAVGRMGC